jgi:hypothetical protein
MPLPSYIPRSDSFGNWYFGGFQVDSAVETGYGAGTALNQTQAEFDTFLNSALGSANWFRDTQTYFLRFANSYEQLAGNVSAAENWRCSNNFVNTFGRINTAPTGAPISLSVANVLNWVGLWSSLNCAFAVANQYGIWVCTAGKGNSGSLTTVVQSMYLGWAKDPVFPTNTTERIRNFLLGTGISSFVATRAPSNTTLPTNCVTNSVITCNVATPGANITDLCVLDPLNNYLNIGSLYNAVFYPGAGLTIGQIYRIPPAQDPDGNTEQNIWLCAGQVYGWNGSAGVANAGYKLIRVWSNNIT